MNVLSREDLEALIRQATAPCVSIFLPTHRAGAGIQQDPIRLKNLLKQAEEQLTAKGIRAADARKLLAPAQKLIPDDLFWRYQFEGLALFFSPDFFRYYRLPLAFSALVVVSDTFHVTPLLPVLTCDGAFYVLALSQNQVRLFQGTRHNISEVSLNGIPRSVSEALKYDVVEKQQAGNNNEPTKENILQFFQQVDRGLRHILREQRAPLVLAAVEYLMPIYREANTYQNLVEAGVEGNPEGAKPEELHKRAWAVVEPRFRQTETEALGRFAQLNGTGRATRRIEDAVAAAHGGRVDCLFVPIGVQAWGMYDSATSRVEVHPDAEPGDQDLIGAAAVQTILHRGAVYALPADKMPDGAAVAAVFRY